MARRSARLQKQPTPAVNTPARSSDDSWMTAESSPRAALPTLPEMPDLPDPGAQTPQKTAASERKPVSKLPHATATPTALKSKSSRSLLPTKADQTPTRTPIKPAGQEMHPALHHASTAKVLDEARWLGFQALGSHTAPSKALPVNQGTPSKTPAPASTAKPAHVESSPSFHFRFKSPFKSFSKDPKHNEMTLSPSTRNLLKEVHGGETPGGSRALFGATHFSSKADVSPQADVSQGRKKVEPKGKMARFSDVHMQGFKKMDSIANHPSAFRADPSRFKPVVAQPLKKSPSKPNLANTDTSKLKRTQSKMDLGETSSSAQASSLKRTQSRADLTGSNLPRSQSTVRLIPATREARPASRDGPAEGNMAAKRVKRTETDDAATTRPVSRGNMAAPAPTPARKITSQTALPRLLASRLMTPTKSSMARSQSAKALKSTSMIPSLAKSPSTNNLFSPTNVAQAMRDSAREGMRKASQNLSRVRSILRTPSRKFSDDPIQIASGTHMSPPAALNFNKALPPMPATAPVKKHVNFTSSTLQRAAEDDLGKSPSPVKFRAGSEIPSGAVMYPNLGVQYPDLAQDSESSTTSPSRRLTFGGATANHPRSFSFESAKTVNLGPASTGTIRVVRKSDASSLIEGKKRKLDTVEEASDKENDGPVEDEFRSAKKAKPTPATPSKASVSPSKLPRRTPGGSAISKSRLAFLATPKSKRGKV